jgi:UDP-N-acetylmuramate--alanine ligase
MPMDFSQIKKVYVIGIKGSGVIALVEIFHRMGIKVSGSDTAEKFFTDNILQKLGLTYAENFSPANVPKDADLIIYSTAYNAQNNVEFAEAQKLNLPMLSYPEVLAHFFNQKFGLAVCGTHGKTTTSALLAEALRVAGTDPGAVIGGKVKNWEANSLSGAGEFFVIEADEFQKKLELYAPKGAILTSLDWDHPDTFPNFSLYKKTFADFVAKIPRTGFLVAWGDSTDVLAVAKSASTEVLTYGFGAENDIKILNYALCFKEYGAEQVFEIEYKQKNLGQFTLSLIGKHNVLNAAAVIAVCYKLNLDLEKVREALGNFLGTARRFEAKGEKNGALLFDDYGHHPEEIKATLKAVREIYPEKNLIAIFHPHSYSRTEALLAEFSQSFDEADQVIVLDIYGSAREYAGKVSAKLLADGINKYCRGKAEHIPTLEAAAEFLRNKINEKDVVLSIGAGNGWEVLEKIKNPHDESQKNL